MSVSSASHREYLRSRVPKLCIATIVFPVVTLIVCFWSRGLSWKGRFALADWLVLAALVCKVAICVLLHGISSANELLASLCGTISRHIEWYHYGHGKSDKELSQTDIVDGLKLLYVASICFEISVTLVKLFALAFHKGLFWTNTTFKQALHVASGGLVLGLSVTFALVMWSCVPIEKFWYKQTPGHCLDEQTWFSGRHCMRQQRTWSSCFFPCP